MFDETSPESLISLPRLDASSAAALGEALRSEAAQLKKLPVPISRALKAVVTALAALHEVLRGRLGSAAPTQPDKRAADQLIDTAVAALHDWVGAFAAIPEGPVGEAAREWRRELFPSKVGFLKLPYVKQWTEIETRLGRIKSQGYDQAMQQMGGEPLLRFVEQAHKAYGEALGITAARPAAEVKETAALRDALQAQLQAIRLYVLRVAAHVDPEDAETAALASRLLRPLTAWKSRPTAAAVVPNADAGEPTPA